MIKFSVLRSEFGATAKRALAAHVGRAVVIDLASLACAARAHLQRLCARERYRRTLKDVVR